MSPSLLLLTGDQRETQECALPFMTINTWDLSRKRAAKYMSLASGACLYSREAMSAVRGKSGEYISMYTFIYTRLLLHCSSGSCLPHTLLSPEFTDTSPHPNRADVMETHLVYGVSTSFPANLPPLGEKALC